MVGKYTDTLKELVVEQVEWYDAPTSSAEEAARFTDEYLRLWDAVRATHATVQGVQDILHLFRQKVREIQQQAQLTGDAAKAYIATYSPFEFAELLVYELLPLAWAVAAFEHGVAIPM